MSMTRQGWCFAPSASSSCYAHSSLWASLRFSKSHGLAHETQAMCLLKWKAANGETQPNVWCVRARSSEKGSWPIRTKFFFPPTVQRRSSTFAKWVGQPLKPQTGAAPARGNQRSAGRSRQAAIHGPTNRWRLVVQMRSDEPGIGLKSGR
jgi:hypothetical protein